MDNLTDQQLLRDYTGRRSEPAFAELVRRHVDLVYSAALRMVRDPHLAEDVTQGVFVALAQNARQLANRPVLSGWLHRTAQNLAANAVRSTVRRRAREQEAAAMNELLAHQSDAVWEHIAPHLDAALGELAEPDRDALLLRYFERKSARDMAQTLGVSEDAAQKRVTRAVERLREYFAKRGVTIGAGGLVMLITANAVQAAPAGLAIAMTAAAALAGTTIQTTTILAATKAIAMTTLQKTLITVTIAAALSSVVIQHQAQVSLRDENQSLREQISQLKADNDNLSNRLARVKSSLLLKLPAPAVNAAAAPIEDATRTNLYARLMNNSTKLTAAQIEPYLKANHRSAASLLAAYRTTGDPALLEEAMRKFPGDPQVAFEAVFQKDAPPEQRRQWLDAFEKSDADNSLPNYLSALDYFKTGQPDQAVKELIAASGKPQFRDYTLDRAQDDEEAYLAAGYPAAEARTIPVGQLQLPQLQQIKDVSLDMVDLANSYRQAGDQTSAQTALQMAANLGQQYANPAVGETEISWMVGMSVERNALMAMDPNSPYGDSGQTVQNRIDYLTQQRAQWQQMHQQVEALQPMMTDQDWVSYTERWRMFGEGAAAKWVINKYSQQ